MTRFVVRDKDGKEIDAVDPVDFATHDGHRWSIGNGAHVYYFEEIDGYTYSVEEAPDETD